MPSLTGRGGGAADGFLIRRLSSPAEQNRENLVGPTPRRRSPLPEWYPRAPLRDITGIVNALERRKLRVQAAQVSRDREASSENPQEPIVTVQTTLPDSTPTRTKCFISSSSPAEHPLPTTSNSSSCSSQIDQSPISVQQQIEAEEKLRRSIDEIEKILNKNLRKAIVNEKAYDNKGVMRRTTLMLMR